MLTVVTANPTQDLTVLATLKRDLKITTGVDDIRLKELIHRASSACAEHCKRVFGKETVSETKRNLRCLSSIALQRYPVVSITSITLDDTPLTSDQYEVNQKNGLLYRLSGNCRIEWGGSKLVIVYEGGYDLLGTLPRALEAAAIELVKEMYFSGPRDPSVKSVEIPGLMAKTYWVAGEKEDGSLPPKVLGYLEDFVRPDAFADD